MSSLPSLWPYDQTKKTLLERLFAARPSHQLTPTGSVACVDACNLWLGVRVPLPFCRLATEGGAVSDSDLSQRATVEVARLQIIRDLMIQDLSRARSAKRRP